MKPKIESLLDCVQELEAGVSVVTETWMHEEEVPEIGQDLRLGHGMGVLASCRERNNNGVTYVGVALI